MTAQSRRTVQVHQVPRARGQVPRLPARGGGGADRRGAGGGSGSGEGQGGQGCEEGPQEGCQEGQGRRGARRAAAATTALCQQAEGLLPGVERQVAAPRREQQLCAEARRRARQADGAARRRAARARRGQLRDREGAA
eukprot:3021687-Prymnesium_polylepis.1